ncbi:unnamed protein product, partial [Lampetra planeri]
ISPGRFVFSRSRCRFHFFSLSLCLFMSLYVSLYLSISLSISLSAHPRGIRVPLSPREPTR